MEPSKGFSIIPFRVRTQSVIHAIEKTFKDSISPETLEIVLIFCLKSMTMGARCDGVHRGGFGAYLLNK
jgi:hypothetical protein